MLYVRQDSSGAIVDVSCCGGMLCIETSVADTGHLAHRCERAVYEEGSSFCIEQEDQVPTRVSRTETLKKVKFLLTIATRITAMLSLRPLIGSDRIVKLIRWNQGRLPHIFRIYMEFCNYGDLFSLIINYSPLSNEDGNILKERDFIPEPFIWKMFEDLVIAGILMERGDLEPTTKRWGVIVHRDWRSQNVFLGENTSGIYRGFPTSKTGDFGWCAIMPTSEEKHPAWRFYASPPPWEHWPPVSCLHEALRDSKSANAMVGTKSRHWRSAKLIDEW